MVGVMSDNGMTPEERDRLVVLETWRMFIEEKIENQGKTLAGIDQKLELLIAAANMGKGAWWAALKIGGVLVVIFGAVATVANWLGFYVVHK